MATEIAKVDAGLLRLRDINFAQVGESGGFQLVRVEKKERVRMCACSGCDAPMRGAAPFSKMLPISDDCPPAGAGTPAAEEDSKRPGIGHDYGLLAIRAAAENTLNLD